MDQWTRPFSEWDANQNKSWKTIICLLGKFVENLIPSLPLHCASSPAEAEAFFKVFPSERPNNQHCCLRPHLSDIHRNVDRIVNDFFFAQSIYFHYISHITHVCIYFDILVTTKGTPSGNQGSPSEAKGSGDPIRIKRNPKMTRARGYTSRQRGPPLAPMAHRGSSKVPRRWPLSCPRDPLRGLRDSLRSLPETP